MHAIIMSIVRHAATTLGGFLVGSGYLDQGGSEAVIGALMVIAGAFAGAVEKRTRATTPPPAA